MTLALRLVTTGVRDVGRRRWLLVYGLFYIVLTDALYRFGGTGARTVLSLANVVLGLVPLVSLLFGTMYLYHAREFIQMILAQPVSRRALFVGLLPVKTIDATTHVELRAEDLRTRVRSTQGRLCP